MPVDMTIRIAGRAGQGMQSIGYIIAKVFTRHGYHVFMNQDVESRIRGGHSFVQARIADRPVRGGGDRVDLLIALDRNTIDQDLQALADNGVMIFEGEKTGFQAENPNHVAVPLEKLAAEAGKNKIMANTVATGATFALLGFDLQPLLDRLEEEFERKGGEIVERNRASAAAGYDYVGEYFRGTAPGRIPTTPETRLKMLISGSEAMALGAICSGLTFYSGYPMSPSTPIMEYISSKAEAFNIILEQAEDEIAALNMAIGASFAGVRAMTATSGGGFCLMVEAIGLAGMTETPVVVVVAQRPGPATGLPTRTEQADLSFVIHAAHGEFPRAVFAPGNAEQAFYQMQKAFNLADRYQVPVIVLGDQHLNDSYFTVDRLEVDRVPMGGGSILADDGSPSAGSYKRYALNASGISPRIVPGHTHAVAYADSDEHTEEGHITESAEIRKAMMDKRMKKTEGLRGEMGMPEIYPSERSDLVLLGWGSTHGAMREAVDRMNRDGVKSQMVHFSEIYPFPREKLRGKIGASARIIAVENNYTGQFADLFSRETGIPVPQRILKYDGRPFTAGEIREKVQEKIDEGII